MNNKTRRLASLALDTISAIHDVEKAVVNVSDTTGFSCKWSPDKLLTLAVELRIELRSMHDALTKENSND